MYSCNFGVVFDKIVDVVMVELLKLGLLNVGLLAAELTNLHSQMLDYLNFNPTAIVDYANTIAKPVDNKIILRITLY